MRSVLRRGLPLVLLAAPLTVHAGLPAAEMKQQRAKAKEALDRSLGIAESNARMLAGKGVPESMAYKSLRLLQRFGAQLHSGQAQNVSTQEVGPGSTGRDVLQHETPGQSTFVRLRGKGSGYADVIADLPILSKGNFRLTETRYTADHDVARHERTIARITGVDGMMMRRERGNGSWWEKHVTDRTVQVLGADVKLGGLTARKGDVFVAVAKGKREQQVERGYLLRKDGERVVLSSTELRALRGR